MRSLQVAAVLGAFVACGGTTRTTGGVEPDDAILALRSNVRDAQLFVDGRFIAELAQLRAGIAVEPGDHRLELRHDDYFSRYLEITVARAERRTIQLDMAPILP